MSSLRWSLYLVDYANKLGFLILWRERVCLCDLGSRHGYVFLAARGHMWNLETGRLLMRSITTCSSYPGWPFLDTEYWKCLYHGKQVLTTNTVRSVPESRDHTQSSCGVPLSMLSVSHSTSGHIFQCYFQWSWGSILNIISLKINCCPRIFHWWIAKKVWRLQGSI